MEDLLYGVRGRLRHGWEGMDAERKKEERGERLRLRECVSSPP